MKECAELCAGQSYPGIGDALHGLVSVKQGRQFHAGPVERFERLTFKMKTLHGLAKMPLTLSQSFESGACLILAPASAQGRLGQADECRRMKRAFEKGGVAED